jgi:hypothetical protein
MAEVTVKSLYVDDLQRFKLLRRGITVQTVRSTLASKHREALPDNFVIKYEWGVHTRTAKCPPPPPPPPLPTAIISLSSSCRVPQAKAYKSCGRTRSLKTCCRAWKTREIVARYDCTSVVSDRHSLSVVFNAMYNNRLAADPSWH